MKIFMACPAPPRSRKGNRVTAVRWAAILKSLGHRLTIGQDYDGSPCDLMVALHAKKSFPAMRTFRALNPTAPLVLCLTGTDLYRDIRTSKEANQSLAWADRIVLLQALGLQELAPELREKARVIIQSAKPLRKRPQTQRGIFEVSVLGHLRAEKDPFRAGLALRRLPKEIRIRVTQAGAALDERMIAQAKKLMRVEPRYRWLGELSGRRARHVLARSSIMVLSSVMEGGANVISEALADGVPILASEIPGNVGLLGANYPGYFPVRGTEALTELLHRAATDSAWYTRLHKWCARLAPLVEPARELAAWQALLAELVSGSTNHSAKTKQYQAARRGVRP